MLSFKKFLFEADKAWALNILKTLNLMNKAHGATEGEAAAAKAKAELLMKKYNISPNEVEGAPAKKPSSSSGGNWDDFIKKTKSKPKSSHTDKGSFSNAFYPGKGYQHPPHGKKQYPHWSNHPYVNKDQQEKSTKMNSEPSGHGSKKYQHPPHGSKQYPHWSSHPYVKK